MNNLNISYKIIHRLTRLQILLKTTYTISILKFPSKHDASKPIREEIQDSKETEEKELEKYMNKLSEWYWKKYDEQENCRLVEEKLIKFIGECLQDIDDTSSLYENPEAIPPPLPRIVDLKTSDKGFKKHISYISRSVAYTVFDDTDLNNPSDILSLYSPIDTLIAEFFNENNMVNSLCTGMILKICHSLLKTINHFKSIPMHKNKNQTELNFSLVAIILNEARSILNLASKLLNDPRFNLLEEFQQVIMRLDVDNNNNAEYKYQNLFSQISLELLSSFTNLPEDITILIKGYEYMEYEQIAYRISNTSTVSILTSHSKKKKLKLQNVEDKNNSIDEFAITNINKPIKLYLQERKTYDIDSLPISSKNKEILLKHAKISGTLHKYLLIRSFLVDELCNKRCTLQSHKKIRISSFKNIGKLILEKEKGIDQFFVQNKLLKNYVQNILFGIKSPKLNNCEILYLEFSLLLYDILNLEWTPGECKGGIEERKKFYGAERKRLYYFYKVYDGCGEIPNEIQKYAEFDKSKWTLGWNPECDLESNSKEYFESDVNLLKQWRNEFLQFMDETVEAHKHISSPKTKKYLKSWTEKRNE